MEKLLRQKQKESVTTDDQRLHSSPPASTGMTRVIVSSTSETRITESEPMPMPAPRRVSSEASKSTLKGNAAGGTLTTARNGSEVSAGKIDWLID